MRTVSYLTADQLGLAAPTSTARPTPLEEAVVSAAEQAPAPSQPILRSMRIADLDRSLQVRAQMSEATVARYASEMARGAAFPPGDAFEDPVTGSLLLANGLHRAATRERNGEDCVEVYVRVGDRRAALLWALTQDRNLARTNGDKRHAVALLLTDPEWCGWSDQEIARRAGVDAKTVGNIRKQLGLNTNARKGRDGRTRKVTQVGRRPKSEATRPNSMAKAEEGEAQPAPTLEVPESLALLVSDEDARRFRLEAERTGLPPARIAALALRLGLEAFERRPGVVAQLAPKEDARRGGP